MNNNRENIEDSKAVIVYHAECVDGAACLWTWTEAHPGQQPAAVIPYAHYFRQAAENKIRAALTPESTLVFLDAAPEKAFLDELASPADTGGARLAAIKVIDHHKTAVDDLSGYHVPAGNDRPRIEFVLDGMRRSAAKMVWDHLMPAGTPVPEVFAVIDKMDGDASGLKTVNDFAAAALVDSRDISTVPKALESLRGLAKMDFNALVEYGSFLVADQNLKIDKLLSTLSVVSLQVLPDQPAVPVAVVNADVKNFGRQISERLAAEGKKAGSGVALAWFMQKNGVVSVSIRTDGTPDAGAVAGCFRDRFGVQGGGHAGAAAVHFPTIESFVQNVLAAGRAASAPAPAPKI